MRQASALSGHWLTPAACCAVDARHTAPTMQHQFLNSAVSTILANAHLPFLANLFNGSALQGIFFQGIYTDLTPNWYKAVGRSLLISQFVAAVLRIMWLLLR
jgi:hypothetical protein